MTSFNPDTPASKIGEQKLLKELLQNLPASMVNVPVGVGDDCAIIDPPPPLKQEVLTTDLLIEGTHFLRNEETNWEYLGRKAIAANISDIASMGAEPRGILVSLGLPADVTMGQLQKLYAGMINQAAMDGAVIVGGDTAKAPVLVVNIAITGLRPSHGSPMLRSSCVAGHYVYVTGNLGDSRAGLELLLKDELSTYREIDWGKLLLERHLCPAPRVAIGQMLSSMRMRIGCIDISDSLWNELHLLSEASRIGFEINVDSIPASDELREFCRVTGRQMRDYALFSGEEYELLFTCELSREELHPFLEERQISTPVTCVGRAVDNNSVMVVENGSPIEVTDATYKHF